MTSSREWLAQGHPLACLLKGGLDPAPSLTILPLYYIGSQQASENNAGNLYNAEETI